MVSRYSQMRAQYKINTEQSTALASEKTEEERMARPLGMALGGGLGGRKTRGATC